MPLSENLADPSLVLFDLDNTLFDDRHARLAALRELRSTEPLLARRPLSALSREYERLLDAGSSAIMSGGIAPEEAPALGFERLAMYCGERIRAARAAECAARYRSLHRAHRRAVPGSRKLIERLRWTARIGVVTNWVAGEQREKLRAIGLEDVVDFLVTPDTAHATKPDPRIFRQALRTGRSPPERTAMVGDSLVYDIAGARGCGIRPIWLNRGRRAAPPGEPVPELSSFLPTSRAVARITGRG